VLIADVSEHSIGSIFKGRSMKYDRGWDVWGYLYWTGFRQVGGGANGKVSSRLGVGRSKSMLGGGRYIRRVQVGSLYYIRWPSLFLEFV
jgi:hypothetical protein